jgi:Galactose oxidase, central domain
VICGPTPWADKEAPTNTRIGALALLALFVVLMGCGGGGPTPVVVAISPSTANLNQGATQSFTASVPVNWAVQEGATGGSITNTGVYTAPNKTGTFHVIATSQTDTSKSVTATVIVAAVAILLNQTAVTLDVGNQFTFVANVTGTVNTAVSWAIQEGTSGGNITSSGVYTAPGTDGTFHVIATSQADTTQKAPATVTVATLVVSVSPPSDVLGPLGVRTFIVTVNTSLNAKVTWSVQEGAAGGAITPNGQYTAPNTTTGSFHVVARSDQDTSKNAIANVTIVPSGFRPTGDMSTGRTSHTATLLPNGKVLIAGGSDCFGYNYGSCLLSSAEVYDSVSGKFAPTGNMSVTRVSHTATLLTNGKVLVTGGPAASAELYDPTSGAFAATGSMSVGRNSHTATLLANGKVLIAGGQAVSGALATAELYDPIGGTFTATGTTMAAARTSHTATLLANGNVLIAGGSNSAGAALATAELYDPAKGQFTATTLGMVSPRTSHTATLLTNGNVLLTGGNGALLPSAEVYDVVAGTFTATGPMMTARDSHFAILLANGTVLVAGGSSSGDFTAELYNTGSGNFTQTGGMETGRALAAAVLLLDGRVFVSGGSDQISAELYK